MVTESATKEVRQIALNYFGVRLTTDQAASLIRGNADLRAELRGRQPHLDTTGRDYLAMALIDAVLEGKPKTHDTLLGEDDHGWHWPGFGSGDDYAREFYRTFRRRAKVVGYGLVEKWGKF